MRLGMPFSPDRTLWDVARSAAYTRGPHADQARRHGNQPIPCQENGPPTGVAIGCLRPPPGRIVRAETRPQRDPKDAGPLRGVNMAGLKGWFGDRKETGQAGQLWPW